MEPRRLENLDEYFGKLCYTEDNLLSLEGNGKDQAQDIVTAFTKGGEDYCSETRQIGEDLLLGWDIVALFERQDTGFNFKECKLFNSYQQSAKCDRIYKQVVTRAVDSCTFVMLQCGDNIVMAHLNGRNLEDGLKQIKSLLKADGKEVTGVCTSLNDVVRMDFCRKLKREYGDYIKFIIRHNKEAMEPYYGHFELGVYLKEDKEPELFGDIIYNPCSKEAKTFCRQVCAIGDLYNFSIESLVDPDKCL